MKRLTMKEISTLSGVSRGTVDRILHNRGKVSRGAYEKVQRVLDENNFKYNIHASAVPFRKVFHLLICIPRYGEGDFWSQIRKGIRSALDECSDFSIECVDMEFPPFDGEAYYSSFIECLNSPVDAVIMSPVFPVHSKQVCDLLDTRHIPYAFVDMDLPDTKPVAVYTIDQFASGHLMSIIIDRIVPSGESIGLFFADKVRGYHNSSSLRRAGVKEYFRESPRKVHYLDMEISSDELMSRSVRNFLDTHPDIGGIAVTSSHGARVASCLPEDRHISMVSYDLTRENETMLKEGKIVALICQKPETQGYKATLKLLHRFLYNEDSAKEFNCQSIDIVVKDSLPWYRDLDR